jgi:hypothetical protein
MIQFLYTAIIIPLISYIKVLLVGDWFSYSALFCNHYEPTKIELRFGGKKLKIFFFQNKHGRI